MKKVFVLFSVMAGVVFTSCSKDDDQTPEEALVGTWKIQAEFDNGEEYDIEGCNKENQIVFESNQTFKYIDYDEASDGSGECVLDDDTEIAEWSVDGETLTIKYSDAEDDFEAGTFSVNGNDLTLRFTYEGEDGMVEEKSTYKRQ